MLNDSGNKPKLYGINKKGDIITKLNINAKNNDWEDLAADTDGNIYIGDFGNNEGKRKDLSILKVSASHLDQENEVDIERITFKYENQEKFPPKNKNMYFDCEAFFYFNNNLYLFTKSRVKGDHGKTNMYKVPAKAGNHVAKLVESFTTCEDASCWVTAADISDDGKQVALLTQNGVWLFSNFSTDNFFSGTLKTYPFKNYTQKEGVCFKDNNTLYITDEKAHGEGGNLYEMSLN
ncbi:hypothetical protein GCM10022291_30160 [Postechiella marina]|uniref:Uncharacterized protein n=2 Tax=Postechiella marina TaxID=943941 RepID=A0ABP8CFK9_9FLAO